MKDYLAKAIYSLCPNAEFVIFDNDYSTIVWHVLDGNAPTQSEINIEIEKIKADELEIETTKAAAKEAAQTKLEALGLTADDLKALGLGGN